MRMAYSYQLLSILLSLRGLESFKLHVEVSAKDSAGASEQPINTNQIYKSFEETSNDEPSSLPKPSSSASQFYRNLNITNPGKLISTGIKFCLTLVFDSGTYFR